MINTKNWQKELAQQLRSPAALAKFLGIDLDFWPQIPATSAAFPLLVSRHFAAKINPNSAQDPLLLQILPQNCENLPHPDFSSDPVGDLCAVQQPGILQKYHGRALIMPTATCAINCRHCFRRNFPYKEQKTLQLAQILPTWLQQNPDVTEIILSGGDPLLASDQHLRDIFAVLAQSEVRTVRIHTRLPTVLPQRFDDNFWEALALLPQKLVLVAHVNHAQELDEASHQVFAELRQRGVLLLNQSVLLRGINDSAHTLAELSQALFTQDVTPYYLHQLDRAQGTQHFEVPLERAVQIMDELRQILPGYLVPRWVQEVAGKSYKVPLPG